VSDLGELIVRPENGGLRVLRADPQIAMSHEFFRWLLLNRPPDPSIQLVPGPDGAWQGALVKIHAVNGTYIYRVEDFLGHDRGWRLRWPD
jgi:hypothetical protein